MIDEVDLMLEAYAIKYGNVDVSDDWDSEDDAVRYSVRESEVVYNNYTGEFEVFI